MDSLLARRREALFLCESVQEHSSAGDARELPEAMDDILLFQYAAPVFIRDALRRRFLGVVGVAHHVMRAVVEVVAGPPMMLRLKLKDAKLSADHADGDRPQIDGVSPVTTALLDADVAHQVLINNITKEQL